MQEWFSKLRMMFRRTDVACELREEMDAHFEMEVRTNQERGMKEEEARAAARRHFGSQTLIACPRSGPHAGHVAQLMTYCVLVEDAFARQVPYGVFQYSDARRQIPCTNDRKQEVLQLADEIRRKRRSSNVHRQHRHIGRCRKCSHRSVCEESLS